MAVASLVLAVCPAGAGEVDFVRDVSERAIESLGRERAEAVDLLQALVLEAVAFEATVHFLAKPLGGLDAAEHEQFRDLVHQYLSCLLLINLRTVTAVRDVSIAKTTSGGIVIVKSKIVRPPPKVDKPVYWLLRGVDGQPKLVDLRIENISVIRGRQSEIESLFKASQGDFDQFVRRLKAAPAVRPLCQ